MYRSLLDKKYIVLDKIKFEKWFNNFEKEMIPSVLNEKFFSYYSDMPIKLIIKNVGNPNNDFPRGVPNHEKIRVRFSELWINKTFLDVEFVYKWGSVPHNEYEKYAHREILYKYSEYFRDLFSNASSIKCNPIEINVKSEYFIKALHFMYDGSVEVNSFEDLFCLYFVAYYYKIRELLESIPKEIIALLDSPINNERFRVIYYSILNRILSGIWFDWFK